MTNAELIDSLKNVYGEKADCYHCHSTAGCYGTACMEYLCHAAADALEAAEKRIAIVEEERDLERFAAKNYLDKIDELEAQIPKEGEWIEHRSWGFSYASPITTNYHCSVCDHEEVHNKYHYCPNCGADMRKGEETE